MKMQAAALGGEDAVDHECMDVDVMLEMVFRAFRARAAARRARAHRVREHRQMRLLAFAYTAQRPAAARIRSCNSALTCSGRTPMPTNRAGIRRSTAWRSSSFTGQGTVTGAVRASVGKITRL